MEYAKTLALVFIVVFLFAQIPFSLARWTAVGYGPEGEGAYTIIIQAQYDGYTGTFPLAYSVNTSAYTSENLSVEPILPIKKTQPIRLEYDIDVKDSKDFNILTKSVQVYYLDGDALITSEPKNLSFDNLSETWKVELNVPFKGEYRALVKVIMEKDGTVYGGDFVTYFESDSASENLLMRTDVDKPVLLADEYFEIFAYPEFEGQEIPGLEMLYANVYGSLKKLTWDLGELGYDASFKAPNGEGIYKVSIFADGQDIVTYEKIYVADISRAKSRTCPLATNETTCDGMEEVRKCVSDYKSNILQVSETMLINCFESAKGGIIEGTIICEDRVGDLNGNEQLDTDDIAILENLILPLTQAARAEYAKCADYDLDSDVDEDDLICLTNVVSGKWPGDMSGGACFDLYLESPLAGDLDGDKKIGDDDIALLNKLIKVEERGIYLPVEVYAATDFDQNGVINTDDSYCAQMFLGMELSNPDTLLASGQVIPSYCLEIYSLDACRGIKGDINGDLKIDEVDEILMMLISKKQITGYKLDCADVNSDGRITDEDLACIVYYSSGEEDKYYGMCLNCDSDLPAEYRNTVEICNDGWDNNCDGLVDRTGEGSGDLCTCNANTPCYMVWDADGGTTAGVDDGNYKICRKLEWNSGSSANTTTSNNGYKWVTEDDVACNKDHECQTAQCDGTVYLCAYSGVNQWAWYNIQTEGVPTESEDPRSNPKTCDDGYDNDCHCGDVSCMEEEEGDSLSMFGSGSFWVGAGTGAALGLLGGATGFGSLTQTLSLGTSVTSMFIGDADTKNFFSGFGTGMYIGGALGSTFAQPVSKVATSTVKGVTTVDGESVNVPAGTKTTDITVPVKEVGGAKVTVHQGDVWKEVSSDVQVDLIGSGKAIPDKYMALGDGNYYEKVTSDSIYAMGDTIYESTPMEVPLEKGETFKVTYSDGKTAEVTNLKSINDGKSYTYVPKGSTSISSRVGNYLKTGMFAGNSGNKILSWTARLAAPAAAVGSMWLAGDKYAEETTEWVSTNEGCNTNNKE